MLHRPIGLDERNDPVTLEKLQCYSPLDGILSRMGSDDQSKRSGKGRKRGDKRLYRSPITLQLVQCLTKEA